MSSPRTPTGCLALSDGTVIYGSGFGSQGANTGEVCFNTAITGYQEIMTDPSYAGQIINFTFPHIGNVGANPEDDEAPEPASKGILTRWDPTAPSNWRSAEALGKWMSRMGVIGVGGVDTRSLTRRIRDGGVLHATVAHSPEGKFNPDELVELARKFPGLEGLDLAKEVTRAQSTRWDSGLWAWPGGFAKPPEGPRPKVIAVDYGAKTNILRSLVSAGCDVTVMPATVTAGEIMDQGPKGLFLSNGPGDPEATGEYAVPMIRELLEKTEMPIFGICLGHQLLARALGAKTLKMNHGHHGANHPVKELETGKVEITSMNHGFTVDAKSLPEDAVETHISLFDGTNCGIRMKSRAVFSVQHHPEASPGPQDSMLLFDRFAESMRA